MAELTASSQYSKGVSSIAKLQQQHLKEQGAAATKKCSSNANFRNNSSSNKNNSIVISNNVFENTKKSLHISPDFSKARFYS